MRSAGVVTEEPLIVFVDDEESILDVAVRLFRNQPYECRTFTRPTDALAFLRESRAHVIVSDLRMPEMDGFDFLSQAADICPFATRVALSAHSDRETLLNAINEDHVHRFMVKPWDAAEFISVLRQSVEVATLRYDRDKLLGRLADHSDQLTEHVLALKQPAELGKYTSQIVHNLREPIQAIGSAVFLANLLVDHSSPRGEQLQTYLDHIVDGARELQRIVAGILLHSMDESFYREEPMNLNDVVEREADFFELDRSFKYEIERRLVLDPELPSIRANAAQLKQLVDNLIRNAIDALAESEERILTLRTGVEGSMVYLVVEDTGPGIDAENLEEVFSPFYTTKKIGDGIGIGLASVKHLAEAYGGRVEVASEPGQGSRFTVYLPQ